MKAFDWPVKVWAVNVKHILSFRPGLWNVQISDQCKVDIINSKDSEIATAFYGVMRRCKIEIPFR